MSLFLYNTYSKQKEEFKPFEPGIVRVYSCGPTVYSHPHIGNFRSFMAADLLCRYLRYKGYQVHHIMNITDVGHLTTDDDLSATEEGVDKIQLAAQSEKKTPLEITQFYTDKFFALSKLLNLYPADKYPKATEHIPEMIEIIRVLLAKGYAYEAQGCIYYDVSKFTRYGKLSGNTLENLKAGARVDIKSEKRHPFDFALWKVDPKHLMQWDSPWGRGFPGWHLECSAMSLKYLGHTIDIHTGGEDNIFPHHECEIAQSDVYVGHPVIRYWVHTRHLLVDNQKMSKSLGNFYTVEDILNKGYNPRVLRYALLSSHYRQQVNFNMELLQASRGAIERLDNFMRDIEARASGVKVITTVPSRQFGQLRREFEKSLDDDLNISAALGVLFAFISEINKKLINAIEARAIIQLIYDFDKVLGVLEPAKTESVDAEVIELIKAREKARNEKNFAKSDEIRKFLLDKGIVLEDTWQGTRWKRKL